MRIAHIADIHVRGLTRHDEYRQVFTRFFQECRDLQVDGIVVAGDLWHTKTQGMTPEAIDFFRWFFQECGDTAHTHIILGNHDMNLQNLSRQDAISPIIHALSHPRVHLYKDSGVYADPEIDDLRWHVFSCADEKIPGAWNLPKPFRECINIALYHGSVGGAVSDDGWKMDADVTVDFFKDYDFAMLGDIHKRQFLTQDQRIAYPGSTIPQSFSETDVKGFLLWDIKGRDDFTVNFHPLQAPHPYITIDWQGSLAATLKAAEEAPSGARFRIRSGESIPQVEIKALHRSLKESKSASDIVYKIDRVVDTNTITAEGMELLKDDLRDPAVHLRLLGEYFKHDAFTDDDWERIESLVKGALTQASARDDVHRYTRWSPHKIEWDNTFGYGKGNSIDLTQLPGITGIFAPNKSGKSSLIGTLVYTLFNTTDRGSMKNLHVINYQKGHCRSRIDLGVNGKPHFIERQTVRHENKKRNETYAVTHVNFGQLDDTGEIQLDLNGTQRNDTDANIRRMIGRPEDMLLTNIAVQTGPIKMDHMVSEGSTARRAIASRFLGLDLFETMLASIKSESDDLKSQVSNMPDSDWDELLEEKDGELAECNAKIADADRELSTLREELSALRAQVSSLGLDDVITPADVQSIRDEVAAYKSQIQDFKVKLQKLNDIRASAEREQVEVETALINIDIESLKKKKEQYTKLEREVMECRHSVEKHAAHLKRMEASSRKLDLVPCGTQYPTCKFIKDSHRDRDRLAGERVSHESLVSSLESLQTQLADWSMDDIEEGIQRHSELMERRNKVEMALLKGHTEYERLGEKKRAVTKDLRDAQGRLAHAEENVVDGDVTERAEDLKSAVRQLESKIKAADSSRMHAAREAGRIEEIMGKLQHEKEKYTHLRSEWHVFERLLQAWSKKGIPSQILASQLPLVNAEIAQILHGVVDFTIELEAESGSNALDIYINDTTSRRIFELASGMERMIGSLAIRVALLNVSSLPKSDLLVIDEGFNALDEVYIESVSRLLHSLKRYYKNILLITHVDNMKDVVDNVIEISKDEKKCAHLSYP